MVGIERPRGAMLPLWVGKRWVWIVVDGPGRVGNAVFNASSAGSSQARLLDIGLSLFIYSLVGWSAVEAVTMRSRFAFARWRFGVVGHDTTLFSAHLVVALPIGLYEHERWTFQTSPSRFPSDRPLHHSFHHTEPAKP